MLKLNELSLELRMCVKRVVDFARVDGVDVDITDRLPCGRVGSKPAMRVYYSFKGKQYTTLVRKTLSIRSKNV